MTASSSEPAVRCILLAGGRSSRMGSDKAQVPVLGRRMVDIALAELDRVEIPSQSTVVVSPLDLGLPTGCLSACEDPPYGGPVAGIDAGLSVLQRFYSASHSADRDCEAPAYAEDFVVAVLSVDAPLSPRLVPTMQQLLLTTSESESERHRIEVVHVSGEPLCGVWWASDLRDALEQVRKQRGSLRDRAAWSVLKTREVERVAEINPTGEEQDFDTVEDLATLEKLAKADGRVEPEGLV